MRCLLGILVVYILFIGHIISASIPLSCNTENYSMSYIHPSFSIYDFMLVHSPLKEVVRREKVDALFVLDRIFASKSSRSIMPAIDTPFFNFRFLQKIVRKEVVIQIATFICQ